MTRALSPGGWTAASSHQGILNSCHDLTLSRDQTATYLNAGLEFEQENIKPNKHRFAGAI